MFLDAYWLPLHRIHQFSKMLFGIFCTKYFHSTNPFKVIIMYIMDNLSVFVK